MKKAEGAELLVVGSRGYGRIFGALLGSVSQYVAARAPCPVVVMRPTTTRTSRDLGLDADGDVP
jgi:nucleotide-binding universal stress UspA family protein